VIRAIEVMASVSGFLPVMVRMPIARGSTMTPPQLRKL
jgi:hypothetical protein